MATQVMTKQAIASLIQRMMQQQRTFFQTGQTQSIEFRLTQLRRLKQVILNHQEVIIDAVKADLGRPPFEAYFEVTTVNEINLALKKLKTWANPRPVKTSIAQFPASAWVQPEPLGSVLIIGPWNCPFQLMIAPLVGAIAAGNCAVLKPSEQAPQTSAVVAKLVRAAFDPSYVAVFEGDVTISKQLLKEKFDHIFFTGGATVGKAVMQAAAEQLTPVTLELGGKSPCIVDADVNLETAAKRIIWGKFLNAGQTCIAPDYLLVDARIKQSLLSALQQQITAFYGDNPAVSPDYGRIINVHHLTRLQRLLGNGTVVVGGHVDAEQLYMAPTLIEDISWDVPLMQDEIFGPILPILTYEHWEDAIAQVNARSKPLALYFSPATLLNKDKS